MNNTQFRRCFNPFKLEKHRKINDLRQVPESVRIKYNIDERFRVCTQCRKELNDHIVQTFIPRLYVDQIDENITSLKISVDSQMALNDSDSSSETVYNVPMDLDKGENIEPNANDSQQPQTSRQEFVLSGTSSTSESISKQSSSQFCVSLGTKLPGEE
ncbi:hypothetical protein HCN44_003365 [Aphidius gifuensis]|uniref:Uncharacterized protein n=1 Tax=Aphidius gifuensis TaxID=684658 RepID=A0A834XVP6_APHGI|nr:hypothetical protein HCN44_003365 [Aphidius gifuensis]